MAFIPAENTARVTLNQSMHNNVVSNVFHVVNDTGWSPEELVALCNIVVTWANDHYGSNLSTDLQFVSVAARDMTTEDGPGVEVGFPALSGGDIASPGLPGNVALAVKLKTGFTGRNRNGRWFTAGLTESTVNGNTILDLTRDNIVIAMGQLRDALLGAGYTLVVASFFDGFDLVEFPDGTTRKVPTPRATALLTSVETFVANHDTDSMRRRLNGRGV
jgi:hypothetical protein